MIINVICEKSGERIDALLAQSELGLSRSAASRLLEEGRVTLNGKVLKKSYICSDGEIYSADIPESSDCALIPQDIPLDIVYEDGDLIVVNKPRGLVVHPAPGHPDGTLVNALLHHCGDSLSGVGGEKRPGIVHRIDKDTSGLLIVAKNDASHRALSAQLSDHSLSRVYFALLNGRMKEPSGTVDAPIGRDPKNRKRMAVTPSNSKNAVTHWERLANFQSYSFVKCRLETGRTHQIRVHMAHIGHPLLGDSLYGAASPDKGLEGQCLHAGGISFIHPSTGEKMSFNTDLPDYFNTVLSKLGKEIPS